MSLVRFFQPPSTKILRDWAFLQTVTLWDVLRRDFIDLVGRNSREPRLANHGARPNSSVMRRLRKKAYHKKVKGEEPDAPGASLDFDEMDIGLPSEMPDEEQSKIIERWKQVKREWKERKPSKQSEAEALEDILRDEGYY